MGDEPDRNVLTNHLILENIFSHLAVEDLKSCRLVCSKWDTICTPYLIQSSVCGIRNTDSVCRNLHVFYKDFHDNSPIQFTNFRFEGQFAAEQLEKFFRDQKGFIEELTINNVSLLNAEGVPIPMYDISIWTGLHLQTLCVNPVFSHYRLTMFVIPFSAIGSIKKLFLRDCVATFDGRIAPTNVECFLKQSMCNGQPVPPNYVLDINEYIDVTNLRVLKLNDTLVPNYKLDLTKCVRLEHLSLILADIIGWHKNLILKTLDFGHVPMNLSMLPPSVEELTIAPGGEIFLTYNPEDTFPNLRSLRVCDDGLISRCPNLVRVYISKGCNLESLPSSIRTMVIDECEVVCGSPVQLEKLVMRFKVWNWDRIDRLIDKFNPNTVVLDDNCVCSYARGESGSESDAIFRIEKQMNKSGTFILKKPQSFNQLFRVLSHQPGQPRGRFQQQPVQYILCKNGCGKSIEKSEFLDWINN